MADKEAIQKFGESLRGELLAMGDAGYDEARYLLEMCVPTLWRRSPFCGSCIHAHQERGGSARGRRPCRDCRARLKTANKMNAELFLAAVAPRKV